MNSPPPPQPPLFELPFDSQSFEWSNLLDFTFEDQFNNLSSSWIPDDHNPTVNTSPVHPPSFDTVSETSNFVGSDNSSDKIRKRDPRLTCENFLAGRIPCACPEEDEKFNEIEEGEIGKKRARKASINGGSIRCQVPGCEVDISELKGYHKRHRVCLKCATSVSVLLDGEYKRYCQQCGKFHLLPDFDEGKRSCRRKLERHNKRRRRKPADYRGGDKESQIDQLAQNIACEDKTEKDESPDESDEGNASPRSSHPGSQSAQSENIKSIVTFGDMQIEGRKDKDSSSGDTKNAYSSVCPTGRISFKLYDWNPAEFPRRLRHQIFQWLASMPVELEGYIRPGCIILTMFIAMPHFTWEKLSEDALRHIHNFVNAPESMLFGRGSVTVRLNDMVFRVLKGETSTVKMEILAPRLHYVHPSCFEAGKTMEFVACGSNLHHSKFRFLVSFGGQYLPYSDCQAIPYERTGSCCKGNEDSGRSYEHQMYKICISSTDPTLTGPAFIEVENEFGVSNFIPVLFGDKQICTELKIIQQRLEITRISEEFQRATLSDTPEPCTGFVSRQTTMSDLLLDIGWLIKEPKLDELQSHLSIMQIQRFNCLLRFLIRNESTTVLMKILHSIDIIMDTKKFDGLYNDSDMQLLLKSLARARESLHEGVLIVGEQKLYSGTQGEKADHWSDCYGEYEALSALASTSKDLEKAVKIKPGSNATSFHKNGEAAPLLSKDVIMNMSDETNPVKTSAWSQNTTSTCTRFLTRRIKIHPRPIILAVAVSVVCLGVCAVVIHPDNVGNIAVSIHRCLFGSPKT
ncbi:Squamosa promoter-binding-like protein [Ranunculus cassubicifolius]